MPGFVRRFSFFPGDEVIQQIEGVNIVDLPPPGSVAGQATGFIALVGEFADMRFAVSVDGSGVVTSKIRPQEVFSGQDILDKVGGFDETLGDFGGADGNGFVAVRNKTFSRLMLVPINLCSGVGLRYFRELPLCTAQTNTLPVVPVDGGTISAGREFRSASGGRVRIGRIINFTSLPTIQEGTAGVIAHAGATAATQPFTVAGATFQLTVRPDGQIGIKKGDIVVFGNNNAGARQPLPSGADLGAGTYRVAADASGGSPTVLSLERLDGAVFDFVAATTIPWRIHVSSDADSAPTVVLGSSVAGGYAAADVGGYSVPSRPLTNFAGAFADGNWTASSVLTPLVTPTALTGSSADPLSGLGARVPPSGVFAYVNATQKPNAVNDATIDALYTTAFDGLLSNSAPVSEVNVVFPARTSLTIRAKVKSHVLQASARSRGRMGLVRPDLTMQSLTTAVGAADPGVGANRAERIIYNWPGLQTFIPEAVGFNLKCADGLVRNTGLLDLGSDGWMASILSNLPPERNPGQAAEPVPTVMSTVLGLQRGAPTLDLPEYIVLRSQGVAAPRIDDSVGPIFQSGITTSLTSGEKNILRRRMADFIQDSVGQRLKFFSKLPLTTAYKDSAVSEVDAFLAGLLSVDNPAAQRIDGYTVDDKSGNTAARLAKGIFVIIGRVKLIATGDFLVFQTEIGEGVVLTTTT
jgi:hypothetical protein